MSSEEIQKQFTEKYRFVWKQMLLNNNSKTADIISEMFDLFIDYGIQKFHDGLDAGEKIYSRK